MWGIRVLGNGRSSPSDGLPVTLGCLFLNVVVGDHEEVLVHVVEVVGFSTRHGAPLPGAHHGVLTEDGEFWTDEREMVDVLFSEVVREDLLHGHADMEDLALVELISVVPVRPSIAVKALYQVGPDERCVVNELAHQRDVAIVTARADQPSSGPHVLQGTLNYLLREPVVDWFLWFGEFPS